MNIKVCDLLEKLKDDGWLVTLSWGGGQWECHLCKPAWVTDELAQALALPSGKDEDALHAIAKAMVEAGYK